MRIDTMPMIIMVEMQVTKKVFGIRFLIVYIKRRARGGMKQNVKNASGITSMLVTYSSLNGTLENWAESKRVARVVMTLIVLAKL